VFFSSHVLSDAEALCSRVAVLAKGRLVASGALRDILAFQVSGWELVMAHLTDALVASLGSRVTRTVSLGDGRFQLVLPQGSAPERLLAELVAAGGQLVSLNPLRSTLEDFFLQHVQEEKAS
jgi:ABC-2 type transport system ATP-binding protein